MGRKKPSGHERAGRGEVHQKGVPQALGALSARGEPISQKDLGLAPRAAFWDEDLCRELIEGRRIHDFEGKDLPPRIEGEVVGIADILGDWREKILVSSPGEIRIYTTTLPASDRRISLIRDPIYRLDVAMQAMGYTQVPMLSALPDK